MLKINILCLFNISKAINIKFFVNKHLYQKLNDIHFEFALVFNKRSKYSIFSSAFLYPLANAAL